MHCFQVNLPTSLRNVPFRKPIGADKVENTPCDRRQILRAPAEACGGLEHIVALLPENADIAHAAENPDAILLRLHDHAEVSNQP